MCAVVLGNEVSKDTKPSPATAELRMTHGTGVVKTGRLEAFATLATLPCQSARFLDRLRQVTLVVDGAVRKYTIDNYVWHNASSMRLHPEAGSDRSAVGQRPPAKAATCRLKAVAAPARPGRRLARLIPLSSPAPGRCEG